MTPYRRFSSYSQVAIALGSFALSILILDSAGLQSWASRLSPGLERKLAVPITEAVGTRLKPLGLAKLRGKELLMLADAGWSDDPAAKARREKRRQPDTAAGVPTRPEAKHTLPSTMIVAAVPTVPTDMATLAFPGLKPPVQIALAGDSMMAVGLYPRLAALATNHPQVHFIKAFRSGTGLARPEVFDWQEEYPALLAGASPDIVIAAIGANDGQGFVEDSVVYTFGTPDWERIYGERVEAYIDMLEGSGARVIWLELPPMKAATYNRNIALVNRIAYTVVKEHPAVTWISTTRTIGDADGRYRDFGMVDQKTTRLRQQDGIHMTTEGASLIADPIFTRLLNQVQTKPVPAHPE